MKFCIAVISLLGLAAIGQAFSIGGFASTLTGTVGKLTADMTEAQKALTSGNVMGAVKPSISMGKTVASLPMQMGGMLPGAKMVPGASQLLNFGSKPKADAPAAAPAASVKVVVEKEAAAPAAEEKKTAE